MLDLLSLWISKRKEKSVNKIQYESSSTSSLSKLPKISTLSTTLVLSLLIKTISANPPINNPTIEAIYKLIHKKTQPIANEHPYYWQNSSQKAYDIFESYTMIAVEEEDWKKVWCFFIEINRAETLKLKALQEAMKKAD